jgi:hypothetical protein
MADPRDDDVSLFSPLGLIKRTILSNTINRKLIDAINLQASGQVKIWADDGDFQTLIQASSALAKCNQADYQELQNFEEVKEYLLQLEKSKGIKKP